MTSFAKACIDLSNNLRNLRLTKAPPNPSISTQQPTYNNTKDKSTRSNHVTPRPQPQEPNNHATPPSPHRPSPPRPKRPPSNPTPAPTQNTPTSTHHKKQAPPVPPKRTQTDSVQQLPDDIPNSSSTSQSIQTNSTTHSQARREMGYSDQNGGRDIVSSSHFDNREPYNFRLPTGRNLSKSEPSTHVMQENVHMDSTSIDALPLLPRAKLNCSPSMVHRVASLARSCHPYYPYGDGEMTRGGGNSTFRRSSRPSSANSSPILPHRGSTVAAIKQRLISQGLRFDLTIPGVRRKMSTKYRDHVRRLSRGRPITIGTLLRDERTLARIFSLLTGRELLIACTVCRSWFRLICENWFFDRILIRIDVCRLIMQQVTPMGEGVSLDEGHESKLQLELTQRLQCGLERHIRMLSIIRLTERYAPCLLCTLMAVLPPISMATDTTTCPAPFPIHQPTSKSEALSISANPGVHLTNQHELDRLTTSHSTDSDRLNRECSSLTEPHTFSHLTLHCCAIQDRTLERLLQLLPTLSQLELQCCNELSETVYWTCLSATIRNLCIHDCINVTDESVNAISQLLPNVNQLTLQAYHVTDKAFAYFETPQHGNALHTVRLIQCLELTNQGLINLAFALPGLVELSLSGCTNLCNEGLDMAFGHWKHLVRLDLSWCAKLSDVGLEYVSGELVQLRELLLDRCLAITDIGISHLSNLPRIERLCLRWCIQLSDGAISHLLGMTTLTHLSLAGCKRFTEEGICHLARHPRLRQLEVTNCSGASSRVKAYLAETMPHCQLLD